MRDPLKDPHPDRPLSDVRGLAVRISVDLPLLEDLVALHGVDQLERVVARPGVLRFGRVEFARDHE